MALVRDDCLVPTLDAKELGYIRESSPQQYVPGVFYKVSGWVYMYMCDMRHVTCAPLSDKRRVWSGCNEGGAASATRVPHH